MRAIIFDVDGTLAETEELHRQAFNETFRDHGYRWNWSRADYTRLLRTTGGKERIAAFIRNDLGGNPDPVPIARMHADKTRRYGALIADGAVRLRPGIADLISDARAQGLTLAIATTTSRANVDRLVEATLGTRADALFDVIAAGDEVAAKKPAPDVYALALARLGISADQAVALEDSLNGVRSALAAGLACVVSPGLYTSHEAFPPEAVRVDDFAQVSTVTALKSRLAPALRMV